MFEPDDLLLVLSEAQVRFVVIGGVAVGVHGFVRATKDLDIVPDPAPENLARLARLLAEIHATQIGTGEFSSEEFPYDPTDPLQLAEGANFRLETSHGALDIMQWVPGIETDPAYPELLGQAVEVGFRGTKISVCGIEHLRTMKRTAAREQDLVDLRALGE
jgi:predicted nucleotidyltransferase